MSIAELEKKLAAEEWLKHQEYYMRHPEQRRNNFFMKTVGAGMLQRDDSCSENHNRVLTDVESQ